MVVEAKMSTIAPKIPI